uniref:Uncharacterized protein n=1 Tax=Meloidogyne enterolobii TaxID=390850 RepID=A0A6V7VW25_MELEN|nr:unnamed protein product [Meloidogyne enterolobii]
MSLAEEKTLLDSLALQLGLHYFSEFKTTADDLIKGQNTLNKEQKQRKALLSLRRAILCFHARYPMLSERCYREGALFMDQISNGDKSLLQLRNLFSMLIYQTRCNTDASSSNADLTQ